MILGLFGVRQEHRKRSIPYAAEREVKAVEPGPEHPAAQEPPPASVTQTVPAACPAEPYSMLSQEQRDLMQRFLKGIRLIFERIKQAESRLQVWGEKAQLMEQDYLQELQAVRVCQQQTAQILNHDLERHALNPAIETIVAMAEEFMRLEQTISHLKLKSGLCPAWAEVAGELEISATVVAEKLRALDIVILRPQCNQPFDAALHDICGQLETGDAQLQSKIQSVIASGIQYRNKLLKRARIIVYRHKSNQPIHEQENLK